MSGVGFTRLANRFEHYQMMHVGLKRMTKGANGKRPCVDGIGCPKKKILSQPQPPTNGTGFLDGVPLPRFEAGVCLGLDDVVVCWLET